MDSLTQMQLRYSRLPLKVLLPLFTAQTQLPSPHHLFPQAILQASQLYQFRSLPLPSYMPRHHQASPRLFIGPKQAPHRNTLTILPLSFPTLTITLFPFHSLFSTVVTPYPYIQAIFTDFRIMVKFLIQSQTLVVCALT